LEKQHSIEFSFPILETELRFYVLEEFINKFADEGLFDDN